MTKEELQKIAGAANKATPGPWHCEHFPNSLCQWDVTYGPASDARERFSLTEDFTEADARFISWSRTWVPQLLEEVERLRDALEVIAGRDNPDYTDYAKQVLRGQE